MLGGLDFEREWMIEFKDGGVVQRELATVGRLPLLVLVGKDCSDGCLHGLILGNTPTTVLDPLASGVPWVPMIRVVRSGMLLDQGAAHGTQGLPGRVQASRA